MRAVRCPDEGAGRSVRSLGAPGESRTPDLALRTRLLFQLSYRGTRYVVVLVVGVAPETGFEPATFAVTGRRPNRWTTRADTRNEAVSPEGLTAWWYLA